MGKNDEWIAVALGLGIGVLAGYMIKKMKEDKEERVAVQTCPFCGHKTEKWARTCPSCRNTFPI